MNMCADFRGRLKVFRLTLILNLISLINCENKAKMDNFEVSALYEYLPIPGSKISLENHEDLSAIIDLRPSSSADYSTVYLQLERSQVELEKDFDIVVEAPVSHGIFAVIQELDFGIRDGSILFPENRACTNYIQFQEEVSTGHKTGKICGNISKRDFDSHPLGLIGPRSFTSLHNKIIVSFSKGLFFTANKNRVEVAFTAYRNFHTNRATTTAEMATEGYRFCSNEVNKENLTNTVISAIKSNLTCDGIINCGNDMSSIFAADESRLHCMVAMNIIKVIESTNADSSASSTSSTGSGENRRTKSDGSSFTTFIIVVFIFIFFYGVPATCFIYHNAKLPASLRHAAPSYEDDFSDDNGDSRHDACPPYEMPPAYENLFPGPIVVTS